MGLFGLFKKSKESKFNRAVELQNSIDNDHKWLLSERKEFEEIKQSLKRKINILDQEIKLSKSGDSDKEDLRKRIEGKLRKQEIEFEKSVLDKTKEIYKNRLELSKLVKDEEIGTLLKSEQELNRIGSSYEIIVQAYSEGKIDKRKFSSIRKETEKKLKSVVHYSDMLVLNKDNKLLLLKRNSEDEMFPSKWCLPGGHVDPGEDHKSASIRELAEETLIEVKEEDVDKAGEYINDKVHIEYYKTHLESANLVLNSREHECYEWVDINVLEKYDLILNLRETLNKIFNIEHQPILLKKAEELNIEKSLRHKYIKKEWKDGKWEYIYTDNRTEDKSRSEVIEINKKIKILEEEKDKLNGELNDEVIRLTKEFKESGLRGSNLPESSVQYKVGLSIYLESNGDKTSDLRKKILETNNNILKLTAEKQPLKIEGKDFLKLIYFTTKDLTIFEQRTPKYIKYDREKNKITKDDYYIGTNAEFKSVFENVNNVSLEDFRSKWEDIKKLGELTHSPKSDSEYVTTKDGVYRMGDHWGKCASCFWETNSNSNYDIAHCDFKDFKYNGGGQDIYVLNPEYRDNLINEVNETIYKLGLINDSYKLTTSQKDTVIKTANNLKSKLVGLKKMIEEEQGDIEKSISDDFSEDIEKSHKYIKKEIINGKTKYTYDEPKGKSKSIIGDTNFENFKKVIEPILSNKKEKIDLFKKYTSEDYFDYIDFFRAKLGVDKSESTEAKIKLFENSKKESVKIKDIISVQDYLNEDKVNEYIDRGYSELPKVIETNGKLILFDGKHRVASKLIKGDDEVEVLLLKEKDTEQNKPDYEQIRKTADDIINGCKYIERLPPAGERGRIKAGRRAVEATLLLRGNEETDRNATKEVVKKQESLIEEYAKANGVWVDKEDIEKKFEYVGRGLEAKVYRIDDDYVKKIVHYDVQSHSPIEFLDDRLALHNAVFPHDYYTLEGFGRDDSGFFFVTKQSFVKNVEKRVSQKSINNELENRGFIKKNKDIFIDDVVTIEDFHQGNVVVSKGVFRFIDPVIRLNTPEDGYGGKMEYKNIEVMDTKIEKAFETIKLGYEQGLISEEVFEKAQKVYIDNAENRKLHRVGQPWGSSSKEEQSKGRIKKEEDKPSNKENKSIDEYAKETSDQDLEAASKGDNEELRIAAKKELERRETEHKTEEEKVDLLNPNDVKNSFDKINTNEFIEKFKSLSDDQIKFYLDAPYPKVKEAAKFIADERGLNIVSKEDYIKRFEDFSENKSSDVSSMYREEGKLLRGKLGKLSNRKKSESLSAYVNNGFVEVRKYLTNPDEYDQFVEKSPVRGLMSKTEVEDTIKDLSEIINDHKIDKDIVLNRMVYDLRKNPFFTKLKEGDIYEDKSFSSTSLKKLPEFGDFRIKILAKKGSSVANIGNHGELEYLIDKGAKFRVIEKNEDGSGITVELL